MSNDTPLEQRLAAVETAVADLQRRMAPRSPAPNWLDRIIGSFQDEPEFAKVVEYGKAIRAADRLAEDDES